MKKILLSLAAFSLISFSAWSQSSTRQEALLETMEPVYEALEDGAEPNGGMEAFYKSIGESIRYPAAAIKNRVAGKVYVEFIVTKEGKIEDVKVAKGVEKSLDKEAVRVIKLTEKNPGWNPGRLDGENVHTKMVMPIRFQNLGVIKVE